MQFREVRLLTTGVAHDYIGHRGKSLSTNNSEIFLRVASEVPGGAETMALAGAVTGHTTARPTIVPQVFLRLSSVSGSRSLQPVQELYGEHAGGLYKPHPSCTRASHITGLQQFSLCLGAPDA